jgi:membrane-bound ClpP family serine protease
MSQFFIEYGLFLLKAVTIVAAIVAGVIVVAAAGHRAAHEGLEIESINEKYKSLATALRQAVLNKDEKKKDAKENKKREKAKAKESSSGPRSFVLDFKGDLKASAVPSLREEVSAILQVATAEDEVIVRLENHGGVVHEHGLAASQLARIRDRDIPLTVCVDKVAASGGYLMACVASKIYVAPFAILGSIGVLAQIPNFNRLLDSHGVDFCSARTPTKIAPSSKKSSKTCIRFSRQRSANTGRISILTRSRPGNTGMGVWLSNLDLPMKSEPAMSCYLTCQPIGICTRSASNSSSHCRNA